jgi:peroxiredoxin
MKMMLQPGDAAPPLSVLTVQGSHWSVEGTKPAAMDLIAIYRGSFCPYCKGFISQLAARRTAFSERGITTVAISMDSAENAAKASSEWGLQELQVGFGLTADVARSWGIFLTTRLDGNQSMTFCEPAMFLVKPDKKIYAVLAQSLPCGRPDLDNLIQGLDFLAKLGYPPRGAA